MQMRSIKAQLLTQHAQAAALQQDLEAAHAQHAQVRVSPRHTVFCLSNGPPKLNPNIADWFSLCYRKQHSFQSLVLTPVTCQNPLMLRHS